MTNDKSLEKFVAKLLKIQTGGNNKPLNENDLKKVAQEMGMNNDDWLNIQKHAENSLLQAKGFMAHQNWIDAVPQLTQAQVIQPYNTEIIYLLALCYYQQWVLEGHSNLWDSAFNTAQHCLQLEPTHGEAIRLISNLRKSSANKKQIKKIGMVVLIGLFGLVIIGVLIHLFTTKEINTTDVKKNIEVENEEGGVVSGESQQFEQPVEFIANEHSSGLTFKPVTSELKGFGDSYSYDIRGYFSIKGYEYEKAELKISIIDEDNDEVSSQLTKILDDYQPVHRSGDDLPFSVLIYEKKSLPKVKKIVVSLVNSIKTPINIKYDPSKKMPYIWDVEKPANFDVEIFERLRTFSSSSENSCYQQLEMEVKNTGKRPINTLKIRIDWINKTEKVVSSSEFFLVSPQQPKLELGKIRLSGGTYGVDRCSRNELKGYNIYITQID